MDYQWDESLETGHETIDEQHKQLFAALISIIEASGEGYGKEEIVITLDFLSEYTVRHFKTEEDLQKEFDYPGYSIHKKRHDDFKVTINEMLSTLEKKGHSKELIDNVVKTIGDWLITHIKGSDLEMASYLKSKGAF
jgi:hemerythrin-like metal-binding protein